MSGANTQEATTATTHAGGHKKGSATLAFDEEDDGENINEEDVELGKTLSFIKCKPSIMKSKRDAQADRSNSMTHQGFSSTKNLIS